MNVDFQAAPAWIGMIMFGGQGIWVPSQYIWLLGLRLGKVRVQAYRPSVWLYKEKRWKLLGNFMKRPKPLQEKILQHWNPFSLCLIPLPPPHPPCPFEECCFWILGRKACLDLVWCGWFFPPSVCASLLSPNWSCVLGTQF